MNAKNLNRSQIIKISTRLSKAIDNLHEKTIYGRVYNHEYLYDLWHRFLELERDIWIDNHLCVYCINGLDHNLNDHELAVERQKITNEI